MFYRSGLIPRWLASWGLVGATLLTVSGMLVMFRVAVPLGTTQTIMAVQRVQEMVLAVRLISKGFKASAIAAAHARESSPRRTTAQAAASPA